LPKGAVLRLGHTRFRAGVRVTHLAFSPDGRQLASWGNWLYYEARVSVWDVATGAEVSTRTAPENQIAAPAWGPDRGVAALLVGQRFHLWMFGDSTKAAPPGRPGGRGAIVQPAGPPGAAPDPTTFNLLALSPDGRRFAAARAGGVDVFEVKGGAAGQDPFASRGPLPGGAVTGLKFVRDGRALLILTKDEPKGEQLAVVWDVDRGTASDPVPVPTGVGQGSRQVFDAADDGSALAVGLPDGTVKVFDLPAGRERLSVKKHDKPAGGGRLSDVSAVRFVSGGRAILSAGRDNRQLVWDAATGKDLATLNGHASWVETVAVSPDGRRVATAGQDSLIRLWDTATWQPILAAEGPRETIWRLEVSRDGRYAAAGAGDGSYVWDLATGREVPAVPSTNRGSNLLFAPEGDLLTGNAAGDISHFPLPAGPPIAVAPKGSLLDFTPDGTALLTAQGTTVTVWDWPAGRRRRDVAAKGEVKSAAVSPDGRAAVLGPGGPNGGTVIDLGTGAVSALPARWHWFARAAGFMAGGGVVCGTVGIGSARAEAWSLASRSRVRAFEPPPQRPGGQFYLLAFAVSPDGRRAASVHSDGGVAVYETATGQVLAHFQGHRDGAIAVTWTPDGRRVLSAGGDHQVLVWDVSLPALAGLVTPLAAAARPAAWGQLGTLPAKEAVRTMADLAADPDGVAEVVAKLTPAPPADPVALDRLFRDLDDARFAVRDKASQDLEGLGPGAIIGVRERAAKATSAEVRNRAAAFLKQFESDDNSPDRIRYLRGLDILATVNTPAARKVVERLAGGATGTWETAAARQALGPMAALASRE
jgi:WD40 repeat protein